MLMRVKARLTAGLTPTQCVLVLGVLVVTLVGALALAWYFRRRNRRVQWY